MDIVISNFQEYIGTLGAAELRAFEIFSTMGVELIFFAIRYFLMCKSEKAEIAKSHQYRWKLLGYVSLEYIIACIVSLVATAVVVVDSKSTNPFVYFLVNPMIGFTTAVLLSITVLSKYIGDIGKKVKSVVEKQPSPVVVNINNGNNDEVEVTQNPIPEEKPKYITDFLKKDKEYIDSSVIDEDIEKDVQMQKVVNTLVDVVYELSEVSVEYRKEFGYVNTSLESIEKTLLTINQSLIDMRDKNEEENVIECRFRILRFNDEILIGQKHSKEMFDHTLKDIDIYERYCKEHEDFENNITVMAVENIKDKYKSCMINNSFL